MKKTLLLLVVLVALVTLSFPAHSSKGPIAMRRLAVNEINDVQDVVLKELQGDLTAARRVPSYLDSEDPEFKLWLLDSANVKLLNESYTGWHSKGSSDLLLQFFSSLRNAKREHVTPFEGTLTAFWEHLDATANSATKPADKELLHQAARSAQWIDRSLKGAPLNQIAPEARTSFTGLFELLGEYELTSDSRILVALTKDLRIIESHGQSTGGRADQETEFIFDTIDGDNNKVPNWTVYAFSLRNETKRVGNPSTPVTGRLIPGEWLFFAERNGQRSVGAWHVVKNGRLDPPSIIIRINQ